MVGGHWVVRNQEHVAQPAITTRFKKTLAELRELRA
jgi:formimidoylglutamate deiminase